MAYLLRRTCRLHTLRDEDERQFKHASMPAIGPFWGIPARRLTVHSWSRAVQLTGALRPDEDGNLGIGKVPSPLIELSYWGSAVGLTEIRHSAQSQRHHTHCNGCSPREPQPAVRFSEQSSTGNCSEQH